MMHVCIGYHNTKIRNIVIDSYMNIINYLVENGVKNEYGLFCACSVNEIELANKFLKRESNIIFGIVRAMRCKNIELLLYLLNRYNHDLTYVTWNGVLTFVCVLNDSNIQKYAVEKGAIFCKNCYERNRIHNIGLLH